MKNSFDTYCLIAVFSLLGALMIYKERLYVWDVPVLYPRIFGSVLVVLGLIGFSYLTYRSRKKENNIATYICPKCRQSIHYTQAKGKCPTCDVELEPLEGFYDRHPELKGK